MYIYNTIIPQQMSTKLRPQTVKNRKNIGIELRRTHYDLGNDGNL